MPRIRSAKPDFWTDPIMCSLSRDIRFTFKGIWEVCADDYGRFLADSRVIKGAVWPLDDDVTLKKIERYLLTLAETGRLVLYTVHGVRYGFVINWYKHQRVSHPTPSRFPAPPNDPTPEHFASDSGNIPERFASDSVLSGAERNREERIRSGAEGAEQIREAIVREDMDGLDPGIRASDRAAPPAPRVVLPVDAERFVEQLYSLATPKRQLDVRRQLYDALDSVGRGARLRQGVFVKARDGEHLAACCRSVMGDPPRNIDASIVILLEKLKDPPPGPTPSELHKADESKRIALEEGYQRAARSAGLAWAKGNPDEFERIRAEVDANFRGVPDSSFTKMARDTQLAQRCAKASGFPDFATWELGKQEAVA